MLIRLGYVYVVRARLGFHEAENLKFLSKAGKN